MVCSCGVRSQKNNNMDDCESRVRVQARVPKETAGNSPPACKKRERNDWLRIRDSADQQDIVDLEDLAQLDQWEHEKVNARWGCQKRVPVSEIVIVVVADLVMVKELILKCPKLLIRCVGQCEAIKCRDWLFRQGVCSQG